MRSLFNAAGAAAAAASLAVSVHAEWDACELPSVSWIAHDDSTGGSMAYALAPAADGVYVSGTFTGQFALRGSSGTMTVSGHADTDDVFVGKLSAAGGPQMLRGFENHGRDLILDMDFDADADAVAVTGYFLGNLTFGTAEVIKNAKPEGSGDFDGFVAVFDGSTGALRWMQAIASERETKLFGVSIAGGRVATAGYSCVEDSAAPVDEETGRKPDLCSGVVAHYALADGSGRVLQTFTDTSFNGVKFSASGDALFVVGSDSSSSAVGSSDALVQRLTPATLSVEWTTTTGVAGGSDSGWDLDFVDSTHLFVSCSVFGSSGTRAVSGGGSAGYDGSKDGALLKLAQSDGSLVFGKAVPNSRGIRLGESGSSVYLMGLKSGGFFSDGSSLGSFDIFLAKLRATDGHGLWAMDLGGGTNFEYPWSLAIDATGDVYLSGLTASNSLRFGDREVASLPTGGHNAFIAKVATSVETLPSCKSSCSTVKAGFCFVGSQCFEEGHSPFEGQSCFMCDPEVSQTEWTGPNLNSHCFIGGACVSSGSFKGAGSTSVSECQYCDVSRDTGAWTLHAGFANAECEDDGDPATQFPTCGNGRVRNEAFCTAARPCYDSNEDSCFAVQDVCAEGLFYTTSCSEFPAEACYNITKHECQAPVREFGDDSERSCSTGAIPAANCPDTHPCFDFVALVCLEAQAGVAGNNNAAGGLKASHVVIVAAWSAALLML